MGQELYQRVFAHIGLIERDYFGLQFIDHMQVRQWLDPAKRIRKQLPFGPPYNFRLRVKFFSNDPVNLKDELTRLYFIIKFCHLCPQVFADNVRKFFADNVQVFADKKIRFLNFLFALFAKNLRTLSASFLRTTFLNLFLPLPIKNHSKIIYFQIFILCAIATGYTNRFSGLSS